MLIFDYAFSNLRLLTQCLPIIWSKNWNRCVKKEEKTLYLMKAGTMGILHLDVSTTDFVLDVVFLLTGQLFLNA